MLVVQHIGKIEIVCRPIPRLFGISPAIIMYCYEIGGYSNTGVGYCESKYLVERMSDGECFVMFWCMTINMYVWL